MMKNIMNLHLIGRNFWITRWVVEPSAAPAWPMMLLAVMVQRNGEDRSSDGVRTLLNEW